MCSCIFTLESLVCIQQPNDIHYTFLLILLSLGIPEIHRTHIHTRGQGEPDRLQLAPHLSELCASLVFDISDVNIYIY